MSADLYTKDYFLKDCGGAEFYRRYGPEVVKPVQAYALRRAEAVAGMAALDAGCGRGEIVYQLRRRGVEAVGTDLSAAALALAEKHCPGAVVRADARRLPFPAANFDRIFFLGVMDHLEDAELAECFAEFKRVLKPGGAVLASSCANKDYHKRLTYQARRGAARWLGLKEPSPPRSSEDEALHVNEHAQKETERFFRGIGWEGPVEPRPNDKYCLRELYGDALPEGFPLKAPPAWKSAAFRLAFRGPWKRFLARELFCVLRPVPKALS